MPEPDIYARALAELDRVDECCKVGQISTPRVYKLLRALLEERQSIRWERHDGTKIAAADAALREFAGDIPESANPMCRR